MKDPVEEPSTTAEEPEWVPEGYAKLKQISASLERGEKVEPITVRELLTWFEAKRRGWQICLMINEALADAHLATRPHFEHQYIDGDIEFIAADETGSEALSKTLAEADKTGAAASAESEVIPFPKAGEASAPPVISNPTYRIWKLRAANTSPVSVSPNASITAAVTIMLANDFSQLPVMVGDRDVKGVVSWSSIGRNLALGTTCDEVRECMEPARVISADISLFSAITEIDSGQYVLVRDNANKIGSFEF
jgi:hypothetical protein